MDVMEIPPGYRVLWRGLTNEKETEYRWVWSHLIPNGKILDVGCCESALSEALAELGYDVYGIDIRDYPKHPQRFMFVREDIRTTSFPSDFFDQIIAVSTIEHVGMYVYGNAWFDTQYGDRMAILEMYRILKSSGTMLITLPYGSSKGDYWIKYYNKESLKRLFRGLVWTATYYLKEGGIWRPCMAYEAEQMPSGEGALPQSIVCVQVVK